MKKINLNNKDIPMHTKQGFILFLLFSILSMCSVLTTLYFARSTTYRYLMHTLITKEKAKHLALGSVALGQSLLHPPIEDKEKQKDDKDSKEQAKEDSEDQKILKQIISYFQTFKSYHLTENVEGIDATLQLSMGSETGKLNINSVYDFAEKKFLNEGKDNDCKKFCEWLFEKISKLTGKQSLFDVFEKHLKDRQFDFNDPTELLQIKEFQEVFSEKLFFIPGSQENNNIYLTDLFTTTTEQGTINPWFLSHSWQRVLDLPAQKELSSEDTQKLIKNFKKKASWENDWDETMKLLYQKDYKDLPKEIKSMLTTDFEATIFSLLLRAMIGETTETIFTILKSNKKKSTHFDIVKIYQI